ncbi:tetratricopeptide repeat protein [Thermoactinospora rubra]|uniref:tetratricopeptide repeat protein n=1 Tax=Thermoactinospora rubra TaxID=1088767 RepID=UPI000A101377|nr:tetratricopeptide repeat protein [Thermoactinospora rubra]
MGGSEEGDQPETSGAWCAEAARHLDAGRLEAALKAARAAAELDPGDEWAHRLLSLAHTRLGRFAEALEEAEEAVRLAPGSWTARLRLSEAAHRVPGRWAQAVEQAELAARFAPDEPEPVVRQGDLALARGDHRRAIQTYERALALLGEPENHDGAVRGAAAQARVNLGLALLRWDRFRAHHDPAWPVDPRETGRARRALDVWARQVRLLLAAATVAVALAALGLDAGAQARAAGLGALLLLVPLTVRQARRVRAWRYVPAMLGRDPWLGAAIVSTALSIAAFAAWLVLPALHTAPLAPVLDPVWAGLAGIVVLGWPALALLRLLTDVWRGRPVKALGQFARAAGERLARRNATVTRWILLGRAWSAQLALGATAAALDPRGAVLELAVPYVLARSSRGTGGDRWLAAAFVLLGVSAAGCAAGGLSGWAWGWRVGLAGKAAVVAVFAVRAVLAWWRGAPGPWRASLLMCEDLLTGEAHPPVGLGPEVRQAFAYARGVALAYGDARGPRVSGAVTALSTSGELRLIVEEDVWAAVERDPRVTVFAADTMRTRHWVEVRGVAWPDGDVLRVTPRRVLEGEFPGRHQRR